MNYAISYVSTAAEGISKEDIQDLLELSSRKNNDHNITGILLYSNGNFFQVLEGEKLLINSLFKFNSYENAFLSLDTAYNREELTFYTSHVRKLHPSIQSPVNYILNNFS